MTDRNSRDPSSEPWQDAYGHLQAEGTEACPDADRLSALLVDELPERERTELADHVIACRRCSATMRDLMELQREAEPELPAAPKTRAGVLTRWRIAAAAAVVVIGAASSLFLWQSDRIVRPGPGAVRGPAPAATALQPADGATLAAAPTQFSWPAEEAATGYTVELYDFESTPIWKSPRLDEPQLVLPDEIGTQLRPGHLYYWRVTAEIGIERRESPLHRFSLAP